MVQTKRKRANSAPALAAKRRRATKFNKRVKEVVLRTNELKLHALQFTMVPSSTMVSQDMTAITTGDTWATRDGQLIYGTSLRGRIRIFNADVPYNWVRILFVRWHPDTSAELPNNNNILGGSQTYFSQQTGEAAHRMKYSVLYDRSFRVWSQTAQDFAYPGPHMIERNIKIGLHNQKINFEPGLNAGKNHIFMLAISDSGTINHPTVDFEGYLRFRDL